MYVVNQCLCVIPVLKLSVEISLIHTHPVEELAVEEIVTRRYRVKFGMKLSFYLSLLPLCFISVMPE